MRIEQRDGSSEANPYLVMAAQVAAGLAGLEQRIEPPPPTESDAYANSAADILPETVPAAIEALKRSDLAREVFGEILVDVVTGIARNEHNVIYDRVSDIERDRYLEVF